MIIKRKTDLKLICRSPVAKFVLNVVDGIVMSSGGIGVEDVHGKSSCKSWLRQTVFETQDDYCFYCFAF